MNNIKTKTFVLIFLVVVFSLAIAGATWAFLTRDIEMTNQNHAINSECFLIDYNVNNENGTKDITGTLFPTGKASGGLSGRVGLKINSSCNMYGTGTLKMHINATTNQDLTRSISSYCISRSTLEKINGINSKSACEAENVKGRWMGYGDSYCENPNTLERIDVKEEDCTSSGGIWTTGGSPLKYSVYNTTDTTQAPIKVGHITSNDIGSDIVLKDDISVIKQEKYYYIYVWLDGYMNDDTFNDKSFSGFINASAIQRENQVPNEYQQVEYLKSAGTQKIVTNIIPNNETGIYAKLSSQDTDNDKIFFGTGSSTNNNRFWAGNISNHLYFGWNGLYGGSDGAVTILENEIKELQFNFLNNRKIIVDDFNYYNIDQNLKTKTETIIIFRTSKIMLYEFKISQGNNIVGNFIPCYNKNTPSQKGLYDIVGDKFYANDGTGAFEIGPEV